MKTISTPDLAALSAQAAARPRQRINLNLHAVLEDPIQRLVNALEPGTYIRPHRHGPGVWEAFILLRGRAAVLTFDDDGRVAERVELAADGVVVAELAEGTRHTIVCLAPDTAVFEIKPGPYVPVDAAGFAAWSPPEGDPGAAACVAWLETAACGEIFTAPR